MRRVAAVIGFVTLMLAGCKPVVYLGPLDSPLGNWKSSESHYYFNGEEVYQDNLCHYSSISFYKDSLCCIEGLKGAFEWTYSNDSLVVDSTVWRVTELTGQRMALDFLKKIEKTAMVTKAEEETEEEDTSEILPVEYKGKSIQSDGTSYWYLDSDGSKVPCWQRVLANEDGSTEILCWWDFRADYYLPF